MCKKLIWIFLFVPIWLNGQTITQSPMCYGQPIELNCGYLGGGCGSPGATYNWENSSGSWSLSGTNPELYANPIINIGEIGYNTDRFYLSVQYASPAGGFSAGRVTCTIFKEIVTTPTIVEPKCHDDLNGFISLSVSGGLPPFTYLWNNGKTTKDITNLTAGTYNVTITDFRGCSNVKVIKTGPGPEYITLGLYGWQGVTLTTPPPIILDYLYLEPALCQHNLTGFATAWVSGGRPPYDYQWSTGEIASATGNSSLARLVPPGPVSVTITDYHSDPAKRCSVVGEGTMTLEPDTVQILVETTDPSIWEDSCSGMLKIKGTKAAFPGYVFTVNGIVYNDHNTPLDSITINKLCSGTYNITVTDLWAGCIHDTVVSLHTLDSFIIKSKTFNSVCGLANGMIKLEIIGNPNVTYSFLWNDGATTKHRVGLTAGVYTVIVTDNFNNSETKIIQLY